VGETKASIECRYLRAKRNLFAVQVDVGFGSKADIRPSKYEVRFAPESRPAADGLECPLSAISDLRAPQQNDPYSITSSARAKQEAPTQREHTAACIIPA